MTTLKWPPLLLSKPTAAAIDVPTRHACANRLPALWSGLDQFPCDMSRRQRYYFFCCGFFSPPASVRIESGAIHSPDASYTLLRELGAGSFGRVRLAGTRDGFVVQTITYCKVFKAQFGSPGV